MLNVGVMDAQVRMNLDEPQDDVDWVKRRVQLRKFHKRRVQQLASLLVARIENLLSDGSQLI